MIARASAIAVVTAAGIAGGSGFLVGKYSLADRAETGSDRTGDPVEQPRRAFDPGAERDIATMRPPVAAAVQAGMATMAGGDPIASLLTLHDIEDEAIRKEALYELIGRFDAGQIRSVILGLLTSDDAPEMALLEELFDDMGDAFALLDRWTELDREGVTEFVTGPRVSEEGGFIDGEMIFRFLSLAFIAQRDPDGAFGLLEGLQGVEGFGDDLDESRQRFEQIVALGIAMKDPALGLRTLRERTTDLEGHNDLDDLFEMLGPRAGEALPEALKFPPGKQRQDILAKLFETWGKTAPVAAIAAAQGLSAEDGKEGIMHRVLRGYAGTDPRGAATFVESMPAGVERDELTKTLALGWMNRDPGNALAWAEQHLDNDALVSLLKSGEERMSPEVGMAVVAELSDAAKSEYFERANISDIDHFIHRMVASDTGAAIAWLQQNGGFEKAVSMGSLFGQAAGAQGVDRAAAILESLPPGGFRRRFVDQVGVAAGAHEPEKALAWAATLPGEESKIGTTAALLGWAGTEPVAAAEHALGLGDGSDGAVTAVLNLWGEGDAGSAYRWLVEAKDADPEAIDKVMADSRLLTHWTHQNPAVAAEAMLGFPVDLAPNYVGDVVGDWAREQPTRASDFINDRLDPGPIRDAAVGALVSRIKEDSPSEAYEWANTITDPQTRANLLRTLTIDSLNDD